MQQPPTVAVVSAVAAAAAFPPLTTTAPPLVLLLPCPNEEGGVLVANTGGVLDPKDDGGVLSGVRGDPDPAEPEKIVLRKVFSELVACLHRLEWNILNSLVALLIICFLERL